MQVSQTLVWICCTWCPCILCTEHGAIRCRVNAISIHCIDHELTCDPWSACWPSRPGLGLALCGRGLTPQSPTLRSIASLPAFSKKSTSPLRKKIQEVNSFNLHCNVTQLHCLYHSHQKLTDFQREKLKRFLPWEGCVCRYQTPAIHTNGHCFCTAFQLTEHAQPTADQRNKYRPQQTHCQGALTDQAIQPPIGSHRASEHWKQDEKNTEIDKKMHPKYHSNTKKNMLKTSTQL